jgi:large subunit ribosomal protein L4
MEIPVYSMAGQQVDRFQIDEEALGGEPNMELVRQAIVTYEANQRVGTADVKRRGEVSGSGRKPWRQKHTGRARHGSRYSPLWVGGAVTHGPQPRDYRKKMTRKARRQATRSALLAKALDGEVMVVERLELPEAKTRAMAQVLEHLQVDRTFLVVLPEHDGELWRCTRNIPGAAMTTWRELNAYEMIRPSRVIFTLEALKRFMAEAGAQEEREAGRQVGVSEDG